MNPSRHIAGAILLALTAMAAPNRAPAENTPATTPATTATPRTTPTIRFVFPTRPGVTPGRPATLKLTDRMWWNQPDMIKALHLTDTQRAQMDKVLIDSLENERAAHLKQAQARTAFEEALTNGDWDAARKAAAELSQATANTLGAQDLLKIEVLSLLGGQQRQTLASEQSHLLRRPWTLAPPPGGIHIHGGPADTKAPEK